MALREDRKGRRHPLQGENMQIWLVGEGKDIAAEKGTCLGFSLRKV